MAPVAVALPRARHCQPRCCPIWASPHPPHLWYRRRQSCSARLLTHAETANSALVRCSPVRRASARRRDYVKAVPTAAPGSWSAPRRARTRSRTQCPRPAQRSRRRTNGRRVRYQGSSSTRPTRGASPSSLPTLRRRQRRQLASHRFCLREPCFNRHSCPRTRLPALVLVHLPA